MFCKYCGTPISDDAVFCEKCGKQIKSELKSENPLVTPSGYGIPYSPKSDDRGKYIASVQYNVAPAVVNIVLDVVFMIAGIVFSSWASKLRFYDRMYRYKDLFVALGIVLILAGAISIVCFIIVIVSNKDVQCTTYENRVIGRAVNARGSSAKVDFDFYYHEIDSAFANNRIVTITSKGVPYLVNAANASEAIKMANIIMGQVQKKNAR